VAASPSRDGGRQEAGDNAQINASAHGGRCQAEDHGNVPAGPAANRGADASGRDAARAPGPPLPRSALTGFLGAGKTTLLNRLLRDLALADTAVIINEFGEVGLDHLLVEQVDEGVVLLSTGCLCCTMRGDLVEALERLLRNLDNGRAAFSRVIIETTGLADPAPVLHTTMVHPYLVMRYRLDGVIAVSTAVNGAATLEAHPRRSSRPRWPTASFSPRPTSSATPMPARCAP
jgi:hypothetical protein